MFSDLIIVFCSIMIGICIVCVLVINDTIVNEAPKDDGRSIMEKCIEKHNYNVCMRNV